MIENFVGVFDNAVGNETKKMIEYYDYMDSINQASNRKEMYNIDRHLKDDHTVFPVNEINPISCSLLGSMLSSVWNVAYANYANKYSILNDAGKHDIFAYRIQKTMPGEGYHQWHFEAASRPTSNRLLAFILYLNTVEEGGETEFLYFPKRVKPVEGRLVLFPASFTHTHRGNPPLSGEKYIFTGWIDLI